jgi:ribonuclease HI
MELSAVILGLRRLNRPCAVTVVTDSLYVKDIGSGASKPKANLDLVAELQAAMAPHQVAFEYAGATKSGAAGNKRAHKLANTAATLQSAEFCLDCFDGPDGHPKLCSYHVNHVV